MLQLENKTQKRFFVYIVTNILNGMRYVGAYTSMRLKAKYMGRGSGVMSAIDEFGKENFIKQECEVDSFEQKQELELFMMEVCDCMWPKGYNKNRVSSGGSFGLNVDDLVKQKISDANSGLNRSDDVKKRISNSLVDYYKDNDNPFKGRKHSQESKDKNSESNKKHWEGRDNPFKGKKHTVESRKKISESHKTIPKKTCEHCGDVCHHVTYSRWHGEKCKNRKIN